MGIVEKLEEFIIGKKISQTRDFSSEYLESLYSGKFTDRVCLGILNDDGKETRFHTVDFAKDPGALFAGKMGSGKSYSMLFTLATWLANNGHHTILFMIDLKKGMNDYAPLFDGGLYEMRSDDRPFKQVYTCFSNEDKIHKVIDLCFSEISAREKLFNFIRASNVQEYEKLLEDEKVYNRLLAQFPGKKIPKKIPRIFLAIEEFHEIPAILDFENNVKKPGTTAKKLASIGKVGRTFGIWFLIATQRAFQSDIPTLIGSSIANRMIHKVLPQEAAYLKVDGAGEIPAGLKGRCWCDIGEVQFPYFGIDQDGKKNLANMLKHMVKPLVAECAYLTDKIILEYLSGRSSEDLYEAKSSEELVESIDNLETEIVLSLLHKRMGYEVERRNYRTDNHGICHIMRSRGKAIAVTFIDGKRIHPSAFPLFLEGINEEGLDGGIVYVLQANVTSKAMGSAKDHSIAILTIEDLMRKARQLDEGTFQSVVKDFSFFRYQEALIENDEEEGAGRGPEKGPHKKRQTKFEDVIMTDKEKEMVDILQGSNRNVALERSRSFEQAFSDGFTRETIQNFFDPNSYKVDSMDDEDIEIKELTEQRTLFE